MTPKRCQICSKPGFKCKKLVLHSFQNPSMHTHARVCIHMHEACVHIRVFAYACPRVSVTFLFQKQFIWFLKELYFFKNTFLKSISIRLGPKLTLGVKTPTSLENRGPSRKRYKMQCLYSSRCLLSQKITKPHRSHRSNSQE